MAKFRRHGQIRGLVLAKVLNLFHVALQCGFISGLLTKTSNACTVLLSAMQSVPLAISDTHTYGRPSQDHHMIEQAHNCKCLLFHVTTLQYVTTLHITTVHVDPNLMLKSEFSSRFL